MSFSLSKSKRFDDKVSDTPAVGQYNIKDQKDNKLGVFDKANRWNSSQDDTSNLSNEMNESVVFSVPRVPFGRSHSTASKKPRPRKSEAPSSATRKVRRSLERKFEDGENDFLHNKIGDLENEMKILKATINTEKALRDEAYSVKEQLAKELEELKSCFSPERKAEEEESIRLLLKKFSDQEEELMRKYGDMEKVIDEAFTIYSKRLAKLVKHQQLMSEHRSGELERWKESYSSMESKCEILNSDYLESKETLAEQEESILQLKEHTIQLENEIKCKEDTCECIQQKLNDALAESERHLKEKETALREYNEFKIKSEAEKEELEASLQYSQKLADEYSKEAESIQSFMNNNIKEMTDKYESLEENFRRMQDYHEECLNRSNQSLKITSQAINEKNKELENLQNMYASTRDENEEQREVICAKDRQLNEFEENGKILVDRLSFLEKAKEDASVQMNQQINNLTAVILEKESVITIERDTVTRLTSEIERAKFMSPEALSDIGIRLSEMEEEAMRWREKYEELERKVGPFLDQLNKFEFEKQALLNENALSQLEMKKLSEKYGQILGHQNTKQKIHHIAKLKQENFELKAEVRKFRAAKGVEQESTKPTKRFDRSKAFSHEGKENQREPLREANEVL